MNENNNQPPKKSFFNNVFYVGLLSFFGGVSQDIFVPILPIYLEQVLGFSKSFIGFTEGVVKASASLFKIISGYLSDKFPRANKKIIFGGYFLSMVSRPLLAIAASPAFVSILRFTDGFGKGIKDSPKDALIAGSSERKTRGKSFGIARALDTFGSVVGPLLLFVLLKIFADNPLKYHYILYITAIPLFFTLAILVWKVKENPVARVVEHPLALPLPRRFYLFLGIMSVFAIGNFSDAFLILRAENVGLSLLSIPLVYALFNFFYAGASIPLGSLSDKIGREKVILIGFLAYGLAYTGFAFAKTGLHVAILFAFYGIYYATTEGVAKAFIADLVPMERRGRAYGIYNSLLGALALPASFIAGFLWDVYGPVATFGFGAALALLSAVLLCIFLFFRHGGGEMQIKEA